MMFASGYWIYGRVALAATLTVVAAASGLALFPIMRRLTSAPLTTSN